MNKNTRILVLIGSALVIAGAFLPWGYIHTLFGSVAVSGMEGDGMLFAGLGAIVLLIGIFHEGRPGKRYSGWAVALSLLVAVLSMAAIGRLASVTSDSEFVSAGTGPGLYVCLLGAVLASIGGVIKLDELDNEKEAEKETRLVRIALYDAHEDLYVRHESTCSFGAKDLGPLAAKLYAEHLPLVVDVHDDKYSINGTPPRCVNDNRVIVNDLVT